MSSTNRTKPSESSTREAPASAQPQPQPQTETTQAPALSKLDSKTQASRLPKPSKRGVRKYNARRPTAQENEDEERRLQRLGPRNLSDIQEGLLLSNSAYNNFLLYLIERINHTGILVFTRPHGPVAKKVTDGIVDDALAYLETSRPAGLPLPRKWFMLRVVNKLKELLRDRKNHRDAKEFVGKTFAGATPDEPNYENNTKGATYAYPPDLFKARSKGATIDLCVISVTVLSNGTRGNIRPVEIAGSRILLPGGDPSRHGSYSFEEFLRIIEPKVNVGLPDSEKIEVQHGILDYFHRGDHKIVTDQDSFEVALCRLEMARGTDNIIQLYLQPESEEHMIERLTFEVAAMRADNDLDQQAAEDDAKIDNLMFEDDAGAAWSAKGKGKEAVRLTTPLPPRTREGTTQRNDGNWPLRPETPMSVQKSPVVFSPPRTSLEDRAFSPESAFTTPGKGQGEESAGRATSIRKVKKSSFTNKLAKKGQSIEDRNLEWSRLFEIKHRTAYKKGGDEDDGEPEVERSAVDTDVLAEEEKELELSEEDEDSGNLVSPGDHVVEKLQNLQNMPELTQIDDPDHPGKHLRWIECCKMFKLDPSKTGLEEVVVVAGLKTKIYQYQAFGVYWQMMTSRKLGGGFVSDTMGLGKTLSFLAYFVVERQLSCLWRAVDDSRKANDGKHLLEDQQHEGDRCPTANALGWISCPCASSNPASKMRPKPGVRLACVPDNLVRNWWAEWKRHVDTSDQTILGLTIIVNYKGAFDNKTTGADLLSDSNTGRNKTRLVAKVTGQGEERAEPYQSGWLVITTAGSYKDWVKKFDHKVQVKGEDGKLKATIRSQIVFGIAMIDESHEEYLKQTGRGKILLDLPSTNQPFVWGYSGTPFSQTPRGLEGVLWAMEQHAKKSGIEWTTNSVLQQFEYRKLDKLCKDFDKEFQSESPDHDKLDDILASFKPFLLNFVLRRTAETLWFGHRIIKLKSHCHQDIVLAVAPDWKDRSAHLQKAILRHEAQFQNEKDQRLLELQEKWDAFPEKRMTPNRPITLRFNTMCRLQWRLRVLASFPFLVKLLYPADPNSKLDLSPVEALNFVRPGEKIKDNPYFKHIRNIVEDSPKLLWLYSLVESMGPNMEKDDKTEPQKLVIITSFPQVAFILKMFMLKYFPEKEEKEQVGLIMPRMKIKERAAILEAFTDVLDVNGKRKHKRNIQILIGTTRQIGTGLQLTRAANIVLMEPDYEFVNEIQAYGRVHRIGQKHDLSCSYRLINSESEVEKAIVERQRDRRETFGRYIGDQDFDDLMALVRPKEVDC